MNSHDRRPLATDGVTASEAATAAELLGRNDRSVVAAWVNGELRDLSHQVQVGDAIAPVLASSEEGLAIIRHSTAHVLAQAVQSHFPEAKLGIGPPIRDGFYYDFQVDRAFVPDDLKPLEDTMKAIVKSDQRFVRRVVTEQLAATELADEPFKLELIQLKSADLNEESSVEVGGGELTIYDNVDPKHSEVVWSDLCRGPHVPSTRFIPTFKLMRIAAAYWRGSEENPQLQRIYGTAWDSKAALNGYLEFLREAERRDHRRVGKDLELFHLDPTAPGMPYWLPKGMRLLNNLLEFWREEHEARGYQEISSPLINHKKLWVTSGHWDHYRDDMFVIDSDEGSDNTYGVKPMNCPNAMVVFNLKTRSYRDLPLRLSDCDQLHRAERSGALHGLLRVQKFQQDDAHIFLPEAEIGAEYRRIFDICDRFYSIFGLTYRYRLGTRPAKFIGDVSTWDSAERILTEILEERTGGDYDLEPGDGAFYGPKIDIMMADVLGRQWQMGTIQLDFQLPRRFECTYVDERGQKVTPVVIHRVIYGSLERFLGIYIEHTGGAFPLWLSPVHVSIIPVAAAHVEYAERVRDELRSGGIRTELDARNETLGNRVRVAQAQKVPLTLVLGASEAEQSTVTVRRRGSRETVTVPLSDFVPATAAAIKNRQDDVVL